MPLIATRNQWRLLKYARPHWKLALGVAATMGFSIVIDLLHPWPTKILVDQVLGDQPLVGKLKKLFLALPGQHDSSGLLFWVVIATVFIFLLGTAVSMINSSLSVRLGQRMTYHLGADLFMHLQRLSLRFHSRQPVGDSIARVTGDPYSVQTLILGAAIPLLQAGITLVAMFVILWRLQPTMTLLSLGVVPFMAINIRLFGKPIRIRGRERRDLETQMISVVERTMNAIPAVQAFTREDTEHTSFRNYADRTVEAYVRTNATQMRFKLFVGLITTLGTAGIMWLGAKYALQGELSVGTILVFLAYLGQLYGPLNAMIYTASTLQSVAANTDRVTEILDTPPDVEDLPGAKDGRISGSVRYEDVTFGYVPDQPVLKEISFQAKPGEVVAIVGPTGAGKTTLVNLMVRFFDPWFGRVKIGGKDIRSFRLRSLREQIALVLQEPFILPITVAENIAYGKPEASMNEIVAAAQAANAHEFIMTLPDRYRTVVGERGATLSGGQKQRLSIARAFLKDAPILILDEPTSALDARTEGLLIEALDRLMKGRITFVIAHRLSTIRRAKQIIVLDQGVMVERGSHGRLIRRNGLYASLYRRQMEGRKPPLPKEVASLGINSWGEIAKIVSAQKRGVRKTKAAPTNGRTGRGRAEASERKGRASSNRSPASATKPKSWASNTSRKKKTAARGK